MSDSQQYPLNLILIKYVEDIVVFLVFNSDNFNMFSCRGNTQVIVVENPHLKINIDI